jgi:hypothetical protein
MQNTMKTYIYNPVTKAHFTKWHNEGVLLLLGAGISYLEDVLEKLDDTTIDRRAQGSQVTRADIDGKNTKVIMYSNGVEEFIIVIATSETYPEKPLLTIYVVND